MAITSAVTRNLDNNCVQVEIKSPNQGTRYYKVPKDKADSFQKEYVQNSKKMYRLSSILNFSAVLAAVAITLGITRNVANKVVKYGTSIIAGLGASVLATTSSEKTAVKNHKNFLQSYNAEEIHYDKDPFSK